MTEHDAHILYLLGLSVFLAPTMKQGRGFASIEDVPEDLLKKADEVYEREFKDEVERKIGLQKDFKEQFNIKLFVEVFFDFFELMQQSYDYQDIAFDESLRYTRKLMNEIKKVKL
jgi:hypothetical protein